LRSVCLSVCLSVASISLELLDRTSRFFVRIPGRRGSVLPWPRCDTEAESDVYECLVYLLYQAFQRRLYIIVSYRSAYPRRSDALAAVWLSGSLLVSINEVTLGRSRLVLGWVTGPGFNFRCE